MGKGRNKENRTASRVGREVGRRASVELIRAGVFEEPSRWNALQRTTHHERQFVSFPIVRIGAAATVEKAFPSVAAAET